MKPQFVYPLHYFNSLVRGLTPSEKSEFDDFRTTVTETAYMGRQFVVYRISRSGELEIYDTLQVQDFVCNEEVGASTELVSKVTGDTTVIGYRPTKVFDYPLFAYLPLHLRVHWDSVKDRDSGESERCSLSFGMVFKTQNRNNPEAPGPVHVLTGYEFKRRFTKSAIFA